MATCRECLHYEACLDYCTEKVLSNRGICEHYIPKSDYVKRERGEWISVKDRLPDKDGKYLVARLEGGKHSISVRKFRKEVPCWYRGYCGHWERRTTAITHWQPLPEPPKGE